MGKDRSNESFMLIVDYRRVEQLIDGNRKDRR